MTNTLRGKSTNLIYRIKLRRQQTLAEKHLWFYLRAKRFGNLKFRRQHGIGPFIADFYCAAKRLVIEVDGDIHEFSQIKNRDEKKERFFKSLGLKVVRYQNDDVFDKLNWLLQDLCARIQL